MGRTGRRILGLTAAVAVAAAVAPGPVRRHLLHPVFVRLRGRHTVAERVGELTAARGRVRAQCEQAGVPFPPGRAVLVGLKDERRLQVYAGPTDGPLRRVATHPILAASGHAGPKLADGDDQVPEGVYGVAGLNPDSAFDVALRVAYPGPLDTALARRERRAGLGGDIMIHGGAASVDCLAVGDPAAEEVFVLAAAVGV